MRNVVITGASAGVGRAIAHRFARSDEACIGLIARGADRLEATAREVRELGGEALVLPCDVADPEAVEAAAEAYEAEFGPIDLWINSAMVTMLAPVHHMSAEEVRRVTEVTYLGCVHGTMTALRRMRPRDRGHILQVGSALAYRSIPLQSAYCGAKHAIVGFTDALRSELIHEGSAIRLSVAHLPAINTPQFMWMRNRMDRHPQPLPPIFQPEVAADGIHYLAHHPRRELWIGASSWLAILGQKFVPGFLDRKLAWDAWDGQMTEDPAESAPDNLFEPVEGNYGAHGPFDARAREISPGLAVVTHRSEVSLLLGVLALGAAAGLILSRPRGKGRR